MKRALILIACSLMLACKSENANEGKTEARVPQKSAATAPLPDGAFKVSLHLSKVPAAIGLGEQRALQVKVKNTGDAVWPALGREDGQFWVKLGDHWLDEKTERVVMDDARALLPNDLAPSEEADLPLIVTAPKKPGDYILEIGMVQERVAWFQEKGASSLKIKVSVK